MSNSINQAWWVLVKLLTIVVLTILFNVWFFRHYISIGIEIQNVFIAITIIDFSIITVTLSVFYLKNILNPIALYSLFIFFFGYSYLPISAKQNHEYSFVTQLVMLFTIFSFLIGCICNRSPLRYRVKKLSGSLAKFFYGLVILFGMLVFSMEVLKIGYVPILNLSSGADVYADTGQNLIAFGHYFVLFMAVIPAISYILYKIKKINVWALIISIIIAVFVIINFLSRQSIMLLLLSSFYSYSYFKRISNLRIAVFGIFVIVMFWFIGNVRLSNIEAGGIQEFLKTYAQVDKDVSLSEIYLTLYSSMNFTSLDNIINNAIMHGKIGLGIYTFHPVFSFLLFDRIGIIKYDPQYDGFNSISTYALDPFLDFNFFGTVIINFIYGFISMNVYRNYISKRSLKSIVNWSIFSFCIIMSSFTNFYNTFFVWFAIILSNKLLNLNFREENISLHSNL